MKITIPKLVYSILIVSTIVFIALLVTIIFPEFPDDSPISSNVTAPTGNGDDRVIPAIPAQP
ncbi:MAG: hypothetical protein L3J89_02675 [Gammaproteobacteria bacterium]|nr:hypothetical protein [Gammaproteobacteria bacterium]